MDFRQTEQARDFLLPRCMWGGNYPGLTRIRLKPEYQIKCTENCPTQQFFTYNLKNPKERKIYPYAWIISCPAQLHRDSTQTKPTPLLGACYRLRDPLESRDCSQIGILNVGNCRANANLSLIWPDLQHG